MEMEEGGDRKEVEVVEGKRKLKLIFEQYLDFF